MTIIKGKVAACELCGECEELRPYGPNKEWICYACGMKDKETTEKRFKEIINNAEDQVVTIVGKDMIRAAKKGDKKAKRIIELYELIEARTEPVAIALLERAITDYKGGGK